MPQNVNFAPQALDDQPLVYFPDGDPAARIGLTMSFYFTHPDNTERRRPLVHCIKQYLQQAEGLLRTYAVKKHRTFQTLKPDENVDPALLDEMIDPSKALEFLASGAEQDGMSHSWSISAYADTDNSPGALGFLHLTYPLSILQTDEAPPRIFTGQFVSLCNVLRVEHAYGGLGLILPFDVGGRSAALQVVGGVAMRFPGLDVDDLTGVSIHCEQGIKAVNFLTAVSDRLLVKVGGAEAVAAQAGAGIEMHRYSNGAVFQAGPVPQLGDSEQGLVPDRYVALGRVLKPLRAPYPDVLMYAPTIADPESEGHDAFTQRWLARFDGD